MKKRQEQFTPDPEFNRPAAPSEEGTKSADDFALRLAALLRADKDAHETAARRQSDLTDISDVAFEEPQQAEVPKAKPAAPQEPGLRPARMEVKPSAQDARDTRPEPDFPVELADLFPEAPEVRPDLSDVPFVPPEEDPSLEEIFNFSPAEEVLAEAGAAPEEPEPVDMAESPESVSVLEAVSLSEPVSAPKETSDPEAPAAPFRDNTDTLPSLEEIFGTPAVPETPAAENSDPRVPAAEGSVSQAPAKESAGRFARRGKLRGLLDSLMAPPDSDEWEEEPDSVPAQAETAFPEPASGAEPDLPAPDAPTADFPAEDPLADIDLDAILKEFTGVDFSPDDMTEAVPTAEHAPEAELSAAPEVVPEAGLSAAPEAVSAEPAEEPEPIPAAEASTVPMNLPKKAAAADLTPPPKRAGRSPKGVNAMTLDELLAAAVPIEEVEPPRITPTQPEETPKPGPRRSRKKSRNRPAARSSAEIAAARVAAAAAKSAASAARAAAAVPMTETAASLTVESPSRQDASAEKPRAGQSGARAKRPAPLPETGSVPTRSGDSTEAEAPRWAPSPRQEEAADPVPSADVRKEAPRPEPPKPSTAARSAPLKRDEDVLPPEESSVLHPEEAYRMYAKPLDEIGSRLVLTGLFTFLSLFFTLYLSQGWTFLPEIFSGGTTVYIQLGLLVLMTLASWKCLFRKSQNAKGLRPTLLLVFAAAFTAADCFPAAKELRSPFTVVVGALLMVFLWGEYDRGMALTTTVKVLRGSSLASGVSEVPEISKDSRGLVRTAPDVGSFMEKLETRDLTQRVLRFYTPIAVIGGIALTLLISFGLKRDIAWTGALIFLGSVPAAGLMTYPRLFLLLSRRLADMDAALCGYHGAEVFGGEHAILIGDEDIFPAGSLTLNGFKVYSGNPDRIIAYAAAAARHSESALDPVFDDLLVTHNGRHYEVDTFRFYDSGGIGASIQEDVVLMGSLDFMRRMGVHMDKGARVKQAVYLSLNGELAAVFAIRYAPPDHLRKGLASIAGNRHFKGILVTRTFLGTPSFLKAKFGIPTSAFLYPSTTERIRLSEAELKRTGAQGAILAKDSFSGFAQAAAGGRMLRSATLGAAILTVLNGISGLLLMGVLAALPALDTATALNLLIYSAAWLIPAVLLSVWGKHF
jgi:hypothetical protein